MPALHAATSGLAYQPRSTFRIRRLRLILMFCLLDVVAPALVILNYFGIDLTVFVNINQLLIFAVIVVLTKTLSRRLLPILVPLFLMMVISFAKMYSLTGGGNFNYALSAVGPYFYSLILPFLVFLSILSQKNEDIDAVQEDLYWFSKWFFILVTPLVLIYAFLYFSGFLYYFGLGVNFHYFAPFFFHRYSYVFGMVVLMLLTGKRAVLLNFLIQFGCFFGGQMRRSPVKVLLIFVLAALGLTLASGSLSILLRRFILMYEVLGTADFSNGLLGLADSYAAIVLFGGRLEEIVGVVQYFADHPGQIWFGSPPGANYIWRVEISDAVTQKSYAHFTWLGYVFRYGLVPTLLLIGFLTYFAITRADTKNPLWLVFVGSLTSATFGANLFYSPVSWVFIALFVRYGSTISENIRTGGRSGSRAGQEM